MIYRSLVTKYIGWRPTLAPSWIPFGPSNPLLIHTLGRPTPRRGLREQQQQNKTAAARGSSRAVAVAAAAAHHARPSPGAAATAAGRFSLSSYTYTLAQCPSGARKTFQRDRARRVTDPRDLPKFHGASLHGIGIRKKTRDGIVIANISTGSV